MSTNPFSPDKSDPKVKSGQPLQINVKEQLHYTAEIGDYPEITLEQAAGSVEIVFDSPAAAAMDKKNAPRETPLGYLALSNYGATVWQPPLEENGVPIKIPIPPLPPHLETRSSIKFNYTLNSDDSRLFTGPINLDAKIVDRLSGVDPQERPEFVKGLRLRLKISSEIDLLSGFDEQKMTEQVQAQIEQYAREQKETTTPASEQERASIKDRLLDKSGVTGKKPTAEADDTNKSKQALEQVHRKQQGYEMLLKDRERNLLRDNELVNKVLKLWDKYRSPELRELAERMVYKVKLARIELKVPYIHHDTFTRIGQSAGILDLDDLVADPSNQVKNAAEAHWQYNPQRQVLELKNHTLIWNPDTQQYEVELFLDLDPPSGQFNELKGTVVLVVEEPLSKISVGWSTDKRSGISSKIPVVYKTWLVLDFTVDFEEAFRKRSFILRRNLHFEGVVFQRDHIENIRHILNNLELLVQSISYKDPPAQADNRASQKQTQKITAVKQGPYLNFVSLEITSEVRKGSHTINYNSGDEQVTRPIPIGSVEIEVFAIITKESVSINALLNDIQMRLEEYFTSNTVEHPMITD